MKLLNILSSVAIVATSSSVFAHVGEHQAGLYEAILHFLSDPVQMWSAGAVSFVVIALNIFWFRTR